jgi:hypothetical protein
MSMQRQDRIEAPQQKLARLQLVARVQLAYEHLREAVRTAGANPARRASIDAARNRLGALNLALAVLALQGV